MTMQTIGPYQLLEELGRGAMGVVFRGFDPAIGRPVAIKVIRPGEFASAVESDELKLRFAREAAAAGRLSHPNIVTVYQLGEDRGVQYLVVELVEGLSLEGMLANGRPQDPRIAVSIVNQVAGALDYAHGAGVVHRDVKPANILVRPDGRVKITDFGIARISSQTVTRTGLTFGTPAYMSPEQIMSARVSGKADQFSLGVIAYQMLSGRRPFAADTDPALMFQIMSAEPPHLHTVNPAVSPRASEVIGRALAKKPDDRFASCREFAGRLAESLSDAGVVGLAPHAARQAVGMPPGVAPVQAKAPGQRLAPRFATRTRLSPLLLWIAAGLVAVGLGAVVWVSWPRQAGPAQRPIADERSLGSSTPPVERSPKDLLGAGGRGGHLPAPKEKASSSGAQERKPDTIRHPGKSDADSPHYSETKPSAEPAAKAQPDGGERATRPPSPPAQGPTAPGNTIADLRSARGDLGVPSGLTPKPSAESTAKAPVDADERAGRLPSPPVAQGLAAPEQTTADLKSARGDLGVQSGLIATNASELQALRRLGERDYFEFKLGKTLHPQRVGDITLLLKSTDPKTNKYTVDIMADDKLTQKKDKNVNEALQFYTSKAKQPYELVVTSVLKNLIVGYLATPKQQPSPTGPMQVNARDGLTYVWVPPGMFLMGCSPGDSECSDDEKPAHQVTISRGFWIGQTEVTQEAYERVMGTNPSNYKGARLPVESVSWNDARNYCQTAGMRLPTEAEWEYAARAGNNGSRYGDIDRIAWYSGNSGNLVHEVGKKQPNAWGVHDVLGNVWEWVADWYTSEYPAVGATDPPGPVSGTQRALRGGAWAFSPRFARASNRYRLEPAYRGSSVGVRCAGNY